jgi:hypothetical protein
MEYKASMFRADSKYRGDRRRLLVEIEKKWVRNEKGRKIRYRAVGSSGATAF